MLQEARHSCRALSPGAPLILPILSTLFRGAELRLGGVALAAGGIGRIVAHSRVAAEGRAGRPVHPEADGRQVHRRRGSVGIRRTPPAQGEDLLGEQIPRCAGLTE